jgi:hypothetical protein
MAHIASYVAGGWVGKITLDFTTAGNKTLYTVPTGYKFILTGLLIRDPSADVSSVNDLQIGRSGDEDEWSEQVYSDDIDLGNMTNSSYAAFASPPGDASVMKKLIVYEAGEVLVALMSDPTSIAATITFDIFGILIPV